MATAPRQPAAANGPWWDLVFGAGFPDWLITSPLPPSAPGERWVFTGRALVPLPAPL